MAKHAPHREGVLASLAKRIWKDAEKIRSSCKSERELRAEIRHRTTKLKEEAREFTDAAIRESDGHVAAESADVVYQLFVVLALRSVSYRAFRAALIKQMQRKRPHRVRKAQKPRKGRGSKRK